MMTKRDQLKARVKELYLEELVKGKSSISPIRYIGFDYPGLEGDLREAAVEWANECLQRIKTIKPSSQAEETFIKMFDGLYADTCFEEYPYSIFFFKGNPSSPEYWFELQNSILWCNYYRVWKVFSKKYSMEYKDIQDLIRPLVEDVFKIRVVKPPELGSTRYTEVESAFHIRNISDE